LVLDLFFMHDFLFRLPRCAAPAVSESLEVRISDAAADAAFSTPKALRSGFLERRDLFFPPRVLEAISVTFRVLHQERVRAVKCKRQPLSPSFSYSVDRGFLQCLRTSLRVVFDMAAAEKHIFEHSARALERGRALDGNSRRRARGDVDDDDFDIDGDDAVAVGVRNILCFRRLLDDPIV
jgi:hypothetical protein